MLNIHQLLMWGHIVTGSLALVLFWIPIAARKGGNVHVQYGRLFVWSMRVTALAGLIMSAMVLVAPDYFKPEYLSDPVQSDARREQLRLFFVLLAYLSWLTWCSVEQGIRALQYKTDVAGLNRWNYQWPHAVLLIAGVVLVVLAVQYQALLHGIFGSLGIVTALGALLYNNGRRRQAKAWLAEHIGNMIGAGIAVYTAFSAFGGRHILTSIGMPSEWFWLCWVAPGVIGGISIFFAQRHYLKPRKPLATPTQS